MSTSSSNYADTNQCETCNQLLDTVQFSGPTLDPLVLNAAGTIILWRRLLEISYLSTVGYRKGTSILDLQIPNSLLHWVVFAERLDTLSLSIISELQTLRPLKMYEVRQHISFSRVEITTPHPAKPPPFSKVGVSHVLGWAACAIFLKPNATTHHYSMCSSRCKASQMIGSWSHAV
jgi:hypothetical protein